MAHRDVFDCDSSKCEKTDMTQSETVQVVIGIADPEQGTSETMVFLCGEHADDLVNALESAGVTVQFSDPEANQS